MNNRVKSVIQNAQIERACKKADEFTKAELLEALDDVCESKLQARLTKLREAMVISVIGTSKLNIKRYKWRGRVSLESAFYNFTIPYGEMR